MIDRTPRTVCPALETQLLFTLVPLDRVYITANFKETQMGCKCSASVRRFMGRHLAISDFDGIVDSIDQRSGLPRRALLPPQNATGNFIKVVQRLPVKILVRQSPDLTFLPCGGNENVEASIYTH